MRRAALAALALAPGGCFAVTAVAPTTYTTVTCEACRLPSVATGQEIAVELDWPCSDEQESDGSCEGFVRATAECRGVPCTSEWEPNTGFGNLRVRATAAGTLHIRVTYTDGLKTLTEDFGPVRVVAPERVELACWARAPGETGYRRCDTGIRAGDDVRIDARALSGDLLLDLPADVEIDGAVIQRGHRSDQHPWICYLALGTPAGPGPATTCVAYGVVAGPHTMRARLGDLASELTLEARPAE